MKISITATPIHRGKVIEGTFHTYTLVGMELTDEAIGRTVNSAIANARVMGWHMADPEIWIRLELRQLP